MTKKKEQIEIEFTPDLKNRTLEEKVNLLLENQENITKIKPSALKDFIQELEMANDNDQLHYCNIMVEHFEEQTLKNKNVQKIFESENIKNVLRKLL